MKFRRFGEFRLLEADGGEIIDAIARAIALKESKSLLYLNPHNFALAAADARLRNSFLRADWVLTDGVGLVLASRLVGERIARRLTLMDYVLPLLSRAEEEGWGVYFLGGSDKVAAALEVTLQKNFPRLAVAGCRHGYFDETAEAEIIREINSVRPGLLFAGLGSPLQENWLIERRAELPPSVLIAAGGSFSNLAGLIPRAPEWMHRNGLEWLFRALQEPRRLGPRYLLGSLHFAKLVSEMSFRSLGRRRGLTD